MKATAILFLCVLATNGCDLTLIPHEDAGTCNVIDMATIPIPDMSATSCPAARGLGGTNLLCVDFADGKVSASELTAKGWLLNAVATGNCAGWQVSNNLLQVGNFSMLNGTCALTLPALSSSQIQQYSRLTLALQHRIDLSDPDQPAQVYLDSATPATRQVWSATGRRDVPRQQTMLTIESAELPAVLKAGFKWYLQISSPGPFLRNGWQIESVAIQGVQ